jgi:glycosyltransferase involved in cell wall biosynthesis
VLLVNGQSVRVAGIEVYLEELIPELALREVPVALLAPPAKAEAGVPINLAPGVEMLYDVTAAKRWNPDAIMVNGRIPAAWEEQLCRSYPSAYFIHNFFGTCISGLKRHMRPRVSVCSRVLGPACLGLYLPLGCGGNNPLTMLRLYEQEKGHQRRLRDYDMLITHSERMREEYLRHGFAESKVKCIPFSCVPTAHWIAAGNAWDRPSAAWQKGEPIRILFAGRMESVKGGAELIEACARWADGGGNHVTLTMAGNGVQRPAWEDLARRKQSQRANLHVDFPGWLAGTAKDAALAGHHLFVMPSLWPEPFGKGGIEAGVHGCPSVGFAVGGIPQWLRDGVNGHLACYEGDPAQGLAEAISKVFHDEEHYRALRVGARERAAEFTSSAHCESLLPLLEEIAHGGKVE